MKSHTFCSAKGLSRVRQFKKQAEWKLPDWAVGSAASKRLQRLNPYARGLAWVYTAILFAMNLIRIFDNNFWGDEAFTAVITRQSLADVVEITASDVHPPLYYIFVVAACRLLGSHGWVYHLVSLIPYAIAMVFAMTCIRKRFGGAAAVTLVTFGSLSTNALCYNVEVRMYSWAALFVLLSFYGFVRVLDDQSLWHCVWFSLASLAAAYTHYYCIVSVAFFYIVLMLAALAKRIRMKPVLLVYAGTVAGYLPWFFILLQTFIKSEGNMWIDFIPGLAGCLGFILSWQVSRYIGGGAFLMALMALVALLYVGLMLVALLYELGILSVVRTDAGKVRVTLSFDRVRIPDTVIVWAGGFLSLAGTIAVGLAISKLVRPFFLTRYMYPVMAVTWVLIGHVLSRTKGRRVWMTLLLVYLLAVFVPGYHAVYTTEKAENDRLTQTLALTQEICPDGCILTDDLHISWTIAAYYYPGVPVTLCAGGQMPQLDPSGSYWVVIHFKGLTGTVREQVEAQHFTMEEMTDDGMLGTLPVSVYRLEYRADGEENDD